MFVQSQRSLLLLYRRMTTSSFGLDALTKIKAVKSCVPELKQVEECDLLVKPLAGGLTNLLCTVQTKPEVKTLDISKRAKSTSETVALVREYGRGTESFMNRPQEEKVVQFLATQGLCPQVYGTFRWGRIEKFLSNARTVSTTEYSSDEYMPKVAELLGTFHAQSTKLLELCDIEESGSKLKQRLEQWFSIAMKVKFVEPYSWRKQKKLNALDLLGCIRPEIEWLFREIEKVNSTVVFCHCDFQQGNILVDDGQLHMIDFEYSDRLERGFDIGNCFCEMSLNYGIKSYPGFVINPDLFPSEEKQVKFLRWYAKGANILFDDAAKKQLLNESKIFVLASHLHWVIWSVVQAHSSTIEFGYLEYAEQRMDQYLYLRSKWFSG